MILPLKREGRERGGRVVTILTFYKGCKLCHYRQTLRKNIYLLKWNLRQNASFCPGLFFARQFKDYHLQGKETLTQDYQTWTRKCCWEKWQECWRIKVVVVLFFPQNRNARTERTRKNYSFGITDSALFGIVSDLHSYLVKTGRCQKLDNTNTDIEHAQKRFSVQLRKHSTTIQ